MENNVNSQVRDLPIFKHFSESEISNQVDSFRKGEKSLFWFIKLGFFGALAFLAWKYVLPTVFVAIGQLLAIVATGVVLLAIIIMLPVIVKMLRALTRFLHKSVIAHDPFAELERQKGLMIRNREEFRASKGKIQGLKNDCEIEADKNDREAKKLTASILTMSDKATKLKNDMAAMVAKDGVAARGTDEFVYMNSEFLKITSDASRASFALQQAKDYVEKYGARAVIMRKFGQKLVMVETSMEIKISDFDATIIMLKKDYDFAEKAKSATTAAKDAMGFSKGWELDYAIDVVTSTISADIAITSGNLKDIDALTKNYALDSDDLYSNLDTLASNIRSGNESMPDSKAYANPEYNLTQNDKIKSGGFGDIF